MDPMDYASTVCLRRYTAPSVYLMPTVDEYLCHIFGWYFYYLHMKVWMNRCMLWLIFILLYRL